jgi:hypothetical protein
VKLRVVGLALMVGDDVTVSVAALLVTDGPTEFDTVTVNVVPLSAEVVAGVV